MGITRHRNNFYFVMRVPRRFAHVDPRAQVRRALFTDSEREARAKEPSIRAEFLAYWEALAAGENDDAAAAFDATRKLAAARGFTYRTGADLAANASVKDILTRLETLVRPDGSYASLAEGAALLGGVEPPPTKISEALREMMEFSAMTGWPSSRMSSGSAGASRARLLLPTSWRSLAEIARSLKSPAPMRRLFANGWMAGSPDRTS